ncbi:hypothetical protein [Psychrobacter pygoscelis]|nr:hypothetical protein [Psychrobacter pygoscelis]
MDDMLFGDWRGYQQAIARARTDNIKDMAIAFRISKVEKKDWEQFINS